MTKHYCDQCEAELAPGVTDKIGGEITYPFNLRTVVYAGPFTQRREFCGYRCLAAWAGAQR